MTLGDLFNLFNVAEESFGNFAKILLPLGVILVLLLIVKWFQSVNKRVSPNITVIRGPPR